MSIGGNFDVFESHDVMHSLDGVVAGHARIDDGGRTPWWSGRLGDWLVVVVVFGIDDVVSGRRSWCSGTCSFVGAWPSVMGNMRQFNRWDKQ